MNSFHFFDLDYTLWNTNSKLAVINKNQPEKVIYRIDPIYIPMMKTYWKQYDLQVRYNGKQYWLNEDIWKEIQDKNKNIKIENIGISDREWNNEEIINRQLGKVEYLLDNLNHLKNDHAAEIGFLTARTNKKAHGGLLKELKDRIYRKLRKNISKIFFVNDLEDDVNNDLTASRKAKIILEHLIGYKIRRNQFIKMDQSKYDDIHFYDDNENNIEAAKNIQIIFERCLRNSDPIIKNEIIDRVKNNDLNYTCYLITNNEIEPFSKKEKRLLLPNMVELF